MKAFSGPSLPGSSFAGLFSVRRLRLPAALALTAGLLSACGGGFKGPPPPCPIVSIPGPTQYLTKFAGANADLSDIAFEAKIEMPTNAQCWYSRDMDQNYIRTAMKVQVDVIRGPKFSGDTANLKYFIAITGPNGEPVKKELFDTSVDFSKGQVSNIAVDVIDPIKIFPKPNENGDYYRIYVGLDLTKEQLDYNKRNPHQ